MSMRLNITMHASVPTSPCTRSADGPHWTNNAGWNYTLFPDVPPVNFTCTVAGVAAPLPGSFPCLVVFLAWVWGCRVRGGCCRSSNTSCIVITYADVLASYCAAHCCYFGVSCCLSDFGCPQIDGDLIDPSNCLNCTFGLVTGLYLPNNNVCWYLHHMFCWQI